MINNNFVAEVTFKICFLTVVLILHLIFFCLKVLKETSFKIGVFFQLKADFPIEGFFQNQFKVVFSNLRLLFFTSLKH